MTKLQEKQKARLRQRVRDMMAGAIGSDCFDDDVILDGCIALDELERWISSIDYMLWGGDGNRQVEINHLPKFITVPSAVEYLWGRRGNFVKGALQ